MNTQKIEQCWNNLANHHQEMVISFYNTLLKRYPQYQEFFTDTILESQRDKMVQTLALVCKLADDSSSIKPYIYKLGQAHKFLDLSAEDLDNFSNTLIEVISMFGEKYDSEWREENKNVWLDAFHNTIKPIMMEGMASTPQEY